MTRMPEALKTRMRPQLKEIAIEASRALAHLDAARLEELALCCQALNREMPTACVNQRAALAEEAKEAVQGLAVFARVLKATRSNADVVNRLRELRAGRQEYAVQPEPQWAPMKGRNGDN